MSRYFEELDSQPTAAGTLSLRRRREFALGVDVFEIKLGDEYLMSSLFTESEIALARLGLAETDGRDLEVLVGGLGLGYTAEAVLRHPAVASVVVVESLGAVIEWHRRGILPLGTALSDDPRCRFVHGDFFALVADPPQSGRFDAILVDIDHAPDHLLDPRHASFYEVDGLRRLAARLRPGGTFGLWSNGLPDESFVVRLADVFATARAEPVTFHNPLQDCEHTQTVYLARTQGGASRGPEA